MSRYIDADKFEVFHYEKTEGRENTFDDGVQFVLEKIDEAPTEDVVKVVHANWVHDGSRNKYWYVCTNCLYKRRGEDPRNIKFCENCGAKINKVKD